MSEQTEEEYLIERLSKLLAEISVIVNGPQPMGVLWSYADLPQKVQALKDAAALNQQAGVVDDEAAVERLASHMYRELCFMDFKYAGKEMKGKMLERARAALAAVRGVES
jgi:hypothetical protein